MNRLCGDCSRPMVPKRAPQPDGYVQHAGRGVCDACRARRSYHGTLLDAPRATLSADDLLDEWAFWSGCGMTVHEFAASLGRNHLSVRQALLRARKRGDERGIIPEWSRRDEQLHERFTARV